MVIGDTGWTAVLHPKPNSTHRVVFFPHAGGSAVAAAPLSAAAPSSVEVVTIQYPGRLWRRAEAPVADVREMAREAARALLAMDDKPTAIVGHSMGAIVGFEAMLVLEAAHPELVTRFFASGHGSPSRPPRRLLNDASDDELIDELRQMGGTDQEFFDHKEVLELVLPALRDDYRAIATYSCAPDMRITSPITALFGQDDPTTTHGQALEWRQHTHGAFDVCVFPGGHFYLNQCAQDVMDTVLEHVTGTIKETAWPTAT